MTEDVPLGDLRFRAAPVKEVSLTVYFDALQTLRVGHLADLRTMWRDQYVRVDETTPLPSWSTGRPAGIEVLVTDSPWPFPSVWFGDDQKDRSIRIQNDRLTLTWRFGLPVNEAQSEYPGYDLLLPELKTRFLEFVDVVKRETTVETVAKRIEIRYENVIEGVSATSFIRGFTVGWESAVDKDLLGSPDYAGMRIHYCASPDSRDCALMIGVDSSDEDGSCFVSLEGSIDIASGDRLEIWDAFDAAHDVLLEKFVDITSDKMRQDWGPV